MSKSIFFALLGCLGIFLSGCGQHATPSNQSNRPPHSSSASNKTESVSVKKYAYTISVTIGNTTYQYHPLKKPSPGVQFEYNIAPAQQGVYWDSGNTLYLSPPGTTNLIKQIANVVLSLPKTTTLNGKSYKQSIGMINDVGHWLFYERAYGLPNDPRAVRVDEYVLNTKTKEQHLVAKNIRMSGGYEFLMATFSNYVIYDQEIPDQYAPGTIGDNLYLVNLLTGRTQKLPKRDKDTQTATIHLTLNGQRIQEKLVPFYVLQPR